MIVNLPVEDAEKWWPVLEPMFLRVTALTNGCYEPEDVRAEIRSGHQKLWVAWDKTRNEINAVMTTSLFRYPRRTAVRVNYVSGGRMKAWIDEFVEEVEKYARSEGATLLEGSFREGWIRMWPGAKEHGVGIVKDLT